MNRQESLICNDMFQKAMIMFSEHSFTDAEIESLRQEIFNYLVEKREELSEGYFGSKYKPYSKENIGV